MFGRKPIGTVAYMGGIPSVYEHFCWNWGQMVQYNQEILCTNDQYIHYDRATMSDHAPARNGLVSRFYGDWLFMLDTDHTFEPDIAHRMLQTMEECKIDVLTGMYQFKKPPYSPVIYAFVDDNELSKPVANWDRTVPVFTVGSAGAGCLMVKRKIYDRVQGELGEEPFTRIDGFSEDHSFFKRLRKLRIQVFCDQRIQCNHVVIKPIELDDFEGFDGDVSSPIKVDGFKV
jgi:hypothetical protein